MKRCHDCNAKKGSPLERMGSTGFIASTKPFKIVGVDYMVQLPTSKKGNKNIIVIVDLFTKWVEAFSTDSSNAKTTANILFQYFTRYGTPEKLLSDRGTSFLNETMTELTKLFGVKQINTTLYHPQTNGTVERFNRVLINILTPFINKAKDDWDELIPAAVMAYNLSVHSTIQEMPAFLVYGREIRMPNDLIRPADTTGNIAKFKSELVEKMKNAFQFTKDIADDVRTKSKDRRDNKRIKHKFKVNDLVSLFRPSTEEKSKKFTKNWTGPFCITEIIEDRNVRLKTLNGKSVKNAQHISRIKKYYIVKPRSKFSNNMKQKEIEKYKDLFGDEQESIVEVEYEVDHVRAWRTSKIDKNKKEFLIRWKSTTSDQDTWEPEENLEGAKELKQEFIETMTCKCGYRKKK